MIHSHNTDLFISNRENADGIYLFLLSDKQDQPTWGVNEMGPRKSRGLGTLVMSAWSSGSLSVCAGQEGLLLSLPHCVSQKAE